MARASVMQMLTSEGSRGSLGGSRRVSTMGQLGTLQGRTYVVMLGGGESLRCGGLALQMVVARDLVETSAE